MNNPEQDVMTCDFETLLALEQQMPPERFEQIKAARPDFAEWLNRLRPIGNNSSAGPGFQVRSA